MSHKRFLFHIRPKMIFSFLLTGLIPLLITGYLGSSLAKEALLDQSFDNLKVIQELRKGEVKASLERMVEEIQRLPDLIEIKNLSRSINEYQKREGVSGNMILDLPEYREQRKSSLRFLKNEAEAYHFDDFYIISADHGDVLLSINEGWELGTNLEYGAYRDSGLADLWRHTVGSGKTTMIDFAPYEPDNNDLYAFLGTPLFDETESTINIAVFKIGPKFITEILNSRRGMGKTGESYLVAYNAKEDNYSLRSDMTSMDYSTGYTHSSNLPYWDDAREAGQKSGEGTYMDSYGNEVLVAYSMVPLLDNAWYLISKINKDEVLSPIDALFRIIFLCGLVIVIVVIIGALFIASNITGPIIASKEFAYKISHGNLDGQLDFENR
ncbi:hypothetical protein, partial [Oceanispirochaeta sp.]|uniref:hypothetical protein n=1 Tax=Oceanispirochaeta sp. TaxID=2035350 RepID=UPI00261837C4